MKQEEKWIAQWESMMDFMESNKRRPSKYAPEERNCWNWLRHNQKMYSKGMLRPERVEKFRKLQELCEKYKHVNQYQ